MSIPLVASIEPPSPLPPRPPTRTSKSLRRVVSDSHRSQQHTKRTPTLDSVLTQAWANEASTSDHTPRRSRKYGLPANPRTPPSISPPTLARTLRPTPDSRRLKLRLFDGDTIAAMKAHLGERGDINAHYLALNGFYGGMEAHYAAYEAAVASEALDLAVPGTPRKASTATVSRKGSTADTLLLPDFTILRGQQPLTADQDVPSSPHAPFEWDVVDPFGRTSSTARPVSVEERHSTHRKMSQPELEVELARKPRPATLQNQTRVQVAGPSTSKSSGKSDKKRMGVILDGLVVFGEMEKRYGGRKI